MLEAGAYWRNPLKPMMGSRQLTEFYILDSEVVAPTGAWVRVWGVAAAAPVGRACKGLATLPVLRACPPAQLCAACRPVRAWPPHALARRRVWTQP